MTLSSSHYQQYLKAMDIELWVLRDTDNAADQVQNHIEPVLNADGQQETLANEKSTITEETQAPVVPNIQITDSIIRTAKSKVEVHAECLADTWEQVTADIGQCQNCMLHQCRTLPVPGVGNIHAKLMVIGDAPRLDEDLQGEPFVGRDGKLLNAMLVAAGFKREQIYIATILKCRPPDDRNPLSEEFEKCMPYIRRQIDLIKPQLILTVGRAATQNLLGKDKDASMVEMRGKQYRLPDTDIPVLVTYHPAYLLRSPQAKRIAWDDLKTLMMLMNNLNNDR